MLVVACDLPSRGTTWEEPDVKALFGDGAAAVIFGAVKIARPASLPWQLRRRTQRAPRRVSCAPAYRSDANVDVARYLAGTHFEMDGPAALRITARHLPDLLDRLLTRAGVCLQQIDLVVLVSRQRPRYRAHAPGRLGIPHPKLVNIFATHGDQVSASLPMALNHALEREMVGKGSLILLLGSAVGVTLAVPCCDSDCGVIGRPGCLSTFNAFSTPACARHRRHRLPRWCHRPVPGRSSPDPLRCHD